jgi:hypothetical protein
MEAVAAQPSLIPAPQPSQPQIETTEQFLAAVNILTNGVAGPEQIELADQLISEMYKSVKAWNILKEVLSQPGNYEKNVILTTSKLLRVKMFYYFNELPEEYYVPMFGFILSTIKVTTLKPAVAMLAESLIIIYMRIFKGQYSDLLSILAQAFPEDTEENRNNVLEILEVIPGLMDDEKVVIEDELRKEFIKFAIENLQTNILKTLDIASTGAALSGRRKYQLVKCFDEWLLNETKEEVKLQLHRLNMIDLCFSELRRSDGSGDEAADALVHLMSICKDPVVYHDLYKNILKHLMESLPHLKKLIHSLDSERVKFYLTVYDAIILRIFDQMVAEPESEPVKLILYEVLLPIYKERSLNLVCLVTESFITFVDKLRDGSNPDDIDEDDEEFNPSKANPSNLDLEQDKVKRAKFVAAHIPLWKSLVELGCDHCDLTQEELTALGGNNKKREDDENNDEEDSEDAYMIRAEVNRLIRKVSRLLGFMYVFGLLAEKLKLTVVEMSSRNSEDGEFPLETVAKFESQLFCIYGILKKLPPEDINEDIQKAGTNMLELVLHTKLNNPNVLYTSLKIITKCSRFFGTRYS